MRWKVLSWCEALDGQTWNWEQGLKDLEDDEYLSAGEVSRLLHVSPKTVSRWAAQGLIPCLVTLGGHRRFRKEDVDDIRRRMASEGTEG